MQPHNRLKPALLLSLKSNVTENLSVHHMTTSLQADASNGLQLVNYSLPGLLYPRWCSVSPKADKSESDRDPKLDGESERRVEWLTVPG